MAQKTQATVQSTFTADITDLKNKIRLAKKEANKIFTKDGSGSSYNKKIKELEALDAQLKNTRKSQTEQARAEKSQNIIADQQAKKQAKEKGKQSTSYKKNAKSEKNVRQSMIDQMTVSGIKENLATTATDNYISKMKDKGYVINKDKQFVNKRTKDMVSQNKVMSIASRSVLPKFNGSLLSTMFLAQGLSATFGGMISNTLQMTGIFEAFSGILAGILLPVLMPIVSWLLKLMTAISGNEGMKQFVSYAIIFLAILGPVISFLSQIGLLIGSIGASALPVIGGVLVVILGLFIAIWSIIQLIQAITTGDWLLGLQAISGIITGIALIAAGIAIAMGAAIAPVLLIVAAVAAIVAGIFWAIRNANKIGNFLTGKGWTGDTIGAPPETQLATGGIVTRPTTALIGEAGPEAVIPLSKMGESGMGSNINYNPTINVSMSGSSFDARDLASKVNEALHDDLRSRF
jgi:hypothetical protein